MSHTNVCESVFCYPRPALMRNLICNFMFAEYFQTIIMLPYLMHSILLIVDYIINIVYLT